MVSMRELASRISYDTGYAAKNIKEILDSLVKVIEEEMLSGPTEVKLGRFIFESRLVEERVVRNPLINKVYVNPAHLKCWVRPNATLLREFRKSYIDTNEEKENDL